MGSGNDAPQGHVTKIITGILADDGDGGEAHYDDQGEHDGVFHSCRAVLRLQKPCPSLETKLHVICPLLGQVTGVLTPVNPLLPSIG